MLPDANQLKPWQSCVALAAGTISGIGIANSWTSPPTGYGFMGGVMGFLIGFVVGSGIMCVGFWFTASVENANKTEVMKQKLIEDEYLRMEARKKLERDDK